MGIQYLRYTLSRVLAESSKNGYYISIFCPDNLRGMCTRWRGYLMKLSAVAHQTALIALSER